MLKWGEAFSPSPRSRDESTAKGSTRLYVSCTSLYVLPVSSVHMSAMDACVWCGASVRPGVLILPHFRHCSNRGGIMCTHTHRRPPVCNHSCSHRQHADHRIMVAAVGVVPRQMVMLLERHAGAMWSVAVPLQRAAMWRKLLYSGFETCFGPSTQGAGAKTHLKSRFRAILRKRGAILPLQRAAMLPAWVRSRPFFSKCCQRDHCKRHAPAVLCPACTILPH